MSTNSQWTNDLIEFCNRYDLEIHHIASVINTPKVIPMIRGKSFEFSVKDRLQSLLKPDIWEVTNPYMNAQTGIHDIDVKIVNKVTEKSFSVECKLAGKGSFRATNTEVHLKVKCMRSRTLGEEAAKQRSAASGIPYDSLKTHNDQYLPKEFDLVITSIGNAFYETDEDGTFIWSPPKSAERFLEAMNIRNHTDAFQKFFVARSSDLAANKHNQVACTRKKCSDQNCGFIPNYPIIEFNVDTWRVKHPWRSVEEIERILADGFK